MRSMGQNPTEDEVLNLVIEFDVNGDGTIDFDEFLEMMRKQAEQQDNSAELREAFKIFDRDGNGYIDAAELKKVNKSSFSFHIPFKCIVILKGCNSIWRKTVFRGSRRTSE